MISKLYQNIYTKKIQVIKSIEYIAKDGISCKNNLTVFVLNDNERWEKLLKYNGIC